MSSWSCTICGSMGVGCGTCCCARAKKATGGAARSARVNDTATINTRPATARRDNCLTTITNVSLFLRSEQRDGQQNLLRVQPRSQPWLSHTCTHTFQLGISARRQPLRAIRRGAFCCRIDFRGYALLDLLELRARKAALHQVFFVESDRIALAPVFEQAGREGGARFRFIVRGVATHAERIHHNDAGTFAL